MDAIASIGFGIHLKAYGEESNDFILNAKMIFDSFVGIGVKLNGKNTVLIM
jgi:hypothetical protein